MIAIGIVALATLAGIVLTFMGVNPLGPIILIGAGCFLFGFIAGVTQGVH